MRHQLKINLHLHYLMMINSKSLLSIASTVIELSVNEYFTCGYFFSFSITFWIVGFVIFSLFKLTCPKYIFFLGEVYLNSLFTFARTPSSLKLLINSGFKCVGSPLWSSPPINLSISFINSSEHCISPSSQLSQPNKIMSLFFSSTIKSKSIPASKPSYL